MRRRARSAFAATELQVAPGAETRFVQSVNRVDPADLFGQPRSDHRLRNELDGRCLGLRGCDEVYDDGAHIPTGAVGRQRPLVGLDVNQERPEPTVFLRGKAMASSC